MTGLTHAAAGIAAGLIIASSTHADVTDTFIVTAVCSIGSLFPDIDNASSKLGKHTNGASAIIQLFIGHRTIFHAPLLYITAASLIAVMHPVWLHLFLLFCLGVATHLTLDSLNLAGIPLLWPMPKRFHIAKLRSGGMVDRCLGLIIWLLIFLQLLAPLLRQLLAK